MRRVSIFVLAWVILGLSSSEASWAQELAAPDTRFGVTEAFWLPEESLDLNVGWERILFYWRELQPNGSQDWNTLHVREEWLAQANAGGRTVVGLLKNTAPWASEDGTEAGIPKGLYLPLDDPNNLWAGFLRKVGSYYSQRNVHHWIIWNEPEIKPGIYGYEFGGSVEDYYQLIKVAYKVLREVDNQAVIHLAGLTWWHDQGYLESFFEVATADPEGAASGYFFDVISLHIYFRTETIRSILRSVNSIQDKYGLRKAIWINETNAAPTTDPLWPVDRPVFPVDLEQQAWFIVQAFALGFANGAQSISVYKLLDVNLPPGGESFGIMRPDHSRRPAAEAYKTVASNLSGFRSVSEQQEEDFYVITFIGKGKTTRIMWARTPLSTTIALPAISPDAELVEVSGKRVAISSSGAYHIVDLEGARCQEECQIGGPPKLLVENVQLTGDTTGLVSKTEFLSPLSLATYTPSPTPTASNTPTEMPTQAPNPTKPREITATFIPTPSASATVKPLATLAVPTSQNTSTAIQLTTEELATAVLITPDKALIIIVVSVVVGLGLLAIAISLFFRSKRE